MWRRTEADQAGGSRRDRFLAMLASVASSLNMARDREQAMREMLLLLGATPDVDRIAIHEIAEPEREQASFSTRFEWLRADSGAGQVRTGRPEMQNVAFAKALPSWLPRLRADEAIYGLPAAQAEAEQAYLRTRASESFLVVPIRVGTRLWGMLGLTNSHHERFWSEIEISIFRTVALNLGSTLERFEQAERLQASEQALRERSVEIEQLVEQRGLALALGEAQRRRLIDALPDLVFIKDSEGRYLGCNRAFEAFTGFSEQALLGHRDEELFTRAALPPEWGRDDWSLEEGYRVFQAWAGLFASEDLNAEGEAHVSEAWVTSRTGPRVYLETRKTPYAGPDGIRAGMIGISRDLTQRKLAENAMQENEAKIRQLIEGVPVGIFVMEASGNSYFANQAALDLLGRGILPQGDAAEQLAPYKSYISGSETEYPPERNPLVRAFIYKEKSEVSDIETQLPDGRRVPLYVSGAPVLDAGGELMYAVTAFSDISELKRKEEELIEARERAEAASHAKSDFLANMSHEIRTPMNAIIGLNHLLLRSELAPKQADHVHKIQSAAQNLLGIINDILDFSKIEAGKLRMERIGFDLHQVIVNLSNLLSLRAQEQGLELIIRLKPDLPFALIGDPLRLEQVLLNLVGNAIKFTEAGEVEISVEALDQSADRVQLCFRVRDTGIGIAREQQGKLFQAFSQADSSTTRRYGGTGLGLMISKRLVELMKGQIGFSSEAGAGSVFWFSAWFGRQPGPQRSLPELPADLRGLRVLAIDDHQSVLALIGEYLREIEAELDTAATPAAALEHIRRREAAGEPYDLLLVDWMMPGMSGFELIEACWALSRQRPRTIVMTAYGRDNVFAQAERLALDGILLKPLTPALLLDAVVQAFGNAPQLQFAASESYASLLDPVRGARILLVEDNEINQAVARELLEAEGFAIETAWHGREAIARMNARAYDLVLMDIHMPELDGYAATAELRAQGHTLPIVAMTADAVAGIREQVLAAGMNDFVTKPIALAELFGVLAKWLPATAAATPRPNRQQAQPELPLLPGIEAAEALARLGGNVGLYLKLLKRFGGELPERLDELAAALGHREADAGHQIAHTLKGTAGNLGIVALQSRMASLEPALKAGDWPCAELLFEQTWQQVQALLPELAQISLPAGPAAERDPARQRELMARLGEALQNYDPSAGDLLEQLGLCVNQPICPELEALIEAFDFEAALACWRRLEPELRAEAL